MGFGATAGFLLWGLVDMYCLGNYVKNASVENSY